MIIGFIGFGKVSRNLSRLIKSDDISFATSFEGRSPKDVSENIEVLDTFKEVAEKSDILISSNSQNSALDLNNISPDTTFEIANYASRFVDGALIGKIDSDKPVLYISGKYADDLLFLDEFIKTRKISNKIGDAAILKMLRSTYTKTLSAVLIESSEIAKDNGLEKEFFEALSLTEGDEFKDKAISRITNTLNNSKRKSEELEEIIDYFDGEDLTMVKAALEKLNR